MPQLVSEGSVAWIKEHLAIIVGVVLFVSIVVIAGNVLPRLLDAPARGREAASSSVRAAAPPSPVAAPDDDRSVRRAAP